MPQYRHAGGRPKIFNSPDEFRTECEKYFKMCDDTVEIGHDSKGYEKKIQKPYTVSGLCLYLGVTKVGLLAYKSKEGYKEIYNWALECCENYTEENALLGKIHPVFSMFSLKNNFGWKDQQDINVNQEPEKLSVADIKARLDKSKKE